MPDPPSPLSPLNQTPDSPTPKAAHPRTFWRDIVRRVSRSTSNLPNLNSSTTTSPTETTPYPGTPSPTAPISTKLVEINPAVRQHTDAIRKPQNDPINNSAFDDVPPPEVYDPAWHNNPLRGEAGQLGRAAGPNAPLLPGAFTIKSSDLDDDDGDDDDGDDDDSDDDDDPDPDDRSQHTHQENQTHSSDPPQSERNTLPEISSKSPTQSIPDRTRVSTVPTTSAPNPERQPRDSERSIRSRRSMTWRKQAPAKNPPQTPVKSRSTQRKPSTFDTPCTTEKTTQLLTTALNLLRADYIAFKQNEIRARVPITGKDQTVVQIVAVVTLDQRPASCRVSVRKSFADSFRISSEEFDCFCSELQKKFRDLQHADST